MNNCTVDHDLAIPFLAYIAVSAIIYAAGTLCAYLSHFLENNAINFWFYIFETEYLIMLSPFYPSLQAT